MKRVVQKSILIGIGYYLLVLVNACCNCNWVKHQQYRFTGIYTQNTLYTFASDSMDIRVSNSDTFRKGTYGFELHFDYQVLSQAAAPFHSLVSSAYACKCALDSFQSNTNIDYVTIKTIHDLDVAHPAGSDVTDMFYYVNFSRNPYQVHYHELRSQLPYMSYLESATLPLYIPCYLKTELAQGKRLQFEITSVYRDKTIQKTTTKEVFLQ